VTTRAQVWRVAVAVGEGASMKEWCRNISGISLVILLVKGTIYLYGYCAAFATLFWLGFICWF
jgi:hypothetical protein